MTDNEKKIDAEQTLTETPLAAAVPVSATVTKKKVFMGARKSDSRGGRRPNERVKSEFDQQMIDIRRVTRVVAGGRRFSFSVAMVIGNRKGSVGFGLGKGSDTAAAIDKAVRQARKALIRIPLSKTHSIAHEVRARRYATEIVIKPVPGRGLSAGSAVRTILALGGVKDVNGKVLSRSHNKINIARATMYALTRLRK